jgi:hypothetical protein
MNDMMAPPRVSRARKAGHLPPGTFDRNLSKIDGAEKLERIQRGRPRNTANTTMRDFHETLARVARESPRSELGTVRICVLVAMRLLTEDGVLPDLDEERLSAFSVPSG